MNNTKENNLVNRNDPPPTLVLKVFGNSVIFDTLLQYLSLKEMKNLRATSLIFNQVLSSKYFLRKARVCGFNNEALKSDIKWKNMRLHLNANISEKEAITELLNEHVEFLWLTGNGIYITQLISSSDDEQTHSTNNDLLEGHTIFKRLQHLKTNTTTLNGFKIQDLPGFAENLIKLDLHLNVKCAKIEKMRLLFDNLEYIAKSCKRLTEYLLTYTNFNDPDLSWKEVQKWRLRTLGANARTITSLELEAKSDVEQLRNVKFPSLKHCAIHGQWTKTTAQFLQNQPFLQSFLFDCKKYHCGEPVPVLQTIAEKSQIFKTLVINYADGFKFRDGETSPLLFIREIKSLEFIQVYQETKGQKLYLALWPNLPASLKKIHMTGMERSFATPSISQVSAFPFVNLIELKLFNGNLIEDADLQHICYKLKKLEILEFSWCPNLTDYGLTGRSTQNVTTRSPRGLPISVLKNLKQFSMTHCDNLTNNIVESISFNLLVELDLRDNKSLALTELFKTALWKQNPRLEQLHL